MTSSKISKSAAAVLASARQPTSQEDLKRINDMLSLMQPLVLQLAFRWMDEREYEDILEYKAVLEKQLPQGFYITKMTKRPFGFEFSIGTGAVYKVFCSTTAYGWKRVG